jgi:hypothetical protein
VLVAGAGGRLAGAALVVAGALSEGRATAGAAGAAGVRLAPAAPL